MKTETAKIEKKITVKMESEVPRVPVKKQELQVDELPGVGPMTLEKLESAGFTTVMAVAVATPGELVEASGITESTARKMIQEARDGMKMGFQSGMDYLEKRKSVERLKTGSSNFDQLLDGGFETGAISECFGQYGSAKTQIGHVLAVECQQGDEDAVAVFIDTENTFRPERIIQIAEARGMDTNKVLKNIRVTRAFNSDHQMLLAEKVGELIKDGYKVKVVIVDSLTAHFRAEFVGRGTLAERQQKLNKHMHTLARVADMHNICVYVTNQVMSKPDTFFGDPTEAIGGNIVAHNSTFRIYLRKGKKGTRVAKLVDSPNLPDGEAIFKISIKGIEDA